MAGPKLGQPEIRTKMGPQGPRIQTMFLEFGANLGSEADSGGSDPIRRIGRDLRYWHSGQHRHRKNGRSFNSGALSADFRAKFHLAKFRARHGPP